MGIIRSSWFVIICLLIGGSAIGQATEKSDHKQKKDKNLNENAGVNYSIQSGLMTGFNQNGFYSFLNPQIQMPVTDKVSLNAGLLLERGNFFKPYSGEMASFADNGTRSSLTFGGSYGVNKRLTFSGSGLMELKKPIATGERPFDNSRAKAFRFDVKYEVSDNFHFQAGVEYQEGRGIHSAPGYFSFQPAPFSKGNGFGFPSRY